MNVYLDTSVVLRRMLEQKGAIKDWTEWKGIYSCSLIKVEALRVMDRIRLEGLVTDEQRAALREALEVVLNSITLVQISDYLLDRAGQPFPTVLGTLDAIHLSAALAVREQEGIALTFVTHDDQLARGARSMGFDTEGV